jgi:hypothetical protein
MGISTTLMRITWTSTFLQSMELIPMAVHQSRKVTLKVIAMVLAVGTRRFLTGITWTIWSRGASTTLMPITVMTTAPFRWLTSL